MQRLLVLFLFFFAASCHSKNDDKNGDTAKNWVLSQRILYNYKLDKLGRVDTAFTVIYNYKDGLIFDSGILYSVTRFEDGQPSEELHYQRLKGQKDSMVYSARFGYNALGKTRTISYFKKGLLLREEKTEYGDSSQVKAQTNVQSRAMGGFNLADLLYFKVAPSSLSFGYDTVRSTYQLDAQKRVVGIQFTNGRGTLAREDVNIYSAGAPLYSYGLGPKGDTIVKTSYKPDGNSLMITTENDSFTLIQSTRLGLLLEQLTIYKTRPDRWRQSITYNDQAQRVEEKIYRLM